MNVSGIYHDMNKRYAYALSKSHFLFRLRTAKNDISKVVMHFRDKYMPIERLDTRDSIAMCKVASDDVNDYFECELNFDVVSLRYFFELEDYEGKKGYYGNYEFSNKMIEKPEKMYDCPQNLREEEMFVVPEWAKNKVVYQIFPSRYATTKDVSDEMWYKAPIDYKDNLQGDLRGIINHLEYIKELGIDVIYMTPVFKSESCHKYDTIDYYEVDPSFGTKEDLKELVTKAHNMDMKVILDGVFNHTSPKFFAFKDIMEKEDKSEYVDWYFIEDFPLKYEWGKKPNFKCFGYYGGMPKLNVRNKEVEEYILGVAKYWIEECDIDGWRLDVADEIGHRFWRKFREAVKEVKEDVLIIGEVWHYAPEFLQGDEWDTVMNYHFYYAVKELVVTEEITPSQFLNRMGFMRGAVNTNVFPVLWNLIDSHDTPRFLNCCNEDKNKQKLGAALQLLMPGMPMIYYGDEVALTGGYDPDCRRGMLWKEELQDKEMLSWYKGLTRLRKEHESAITGEITAMEADDENGLMFITRKGNEEYKLIFNCRDSVMEMPLYNGMKNLIDGQMFDGQLKPYQTIVIKC